MKNEIVIVKDFSNRPYGRYPDDGDFCGQNFRQNLLAPTLRKCLENGEVLTVNLDGYNRYGRSFLDEAFGGLIREEGFTSEQLSNHLLYKHSLVPSIEVLIAERIEAAAKAEER